MMSSNDGLNEVDFEPVPPTRPSRQFNFISSQIQRGNLVEEVLLDTEEGEHRLNQIRELTIHGSDQLIFNRGCI